jgi:RimJ/RimL family protein N-acetyltransferase
MTADIQTNRLDLVSLTPDFLRASLCNDLQRAEQQLQAQLPGGWPFGREDLLLRRLKQLENDPSLQPWLLRAMVERNASIVVGHIGFHDAPGAEYIRPYAPGAAEFGFTVYPAFRRQGFAREASIALMRWATEVHGVRNYVLTIRPDNVPSQTLATQLGFERIGSHIDEVDGVEDILEYKVADTTDASHLTPYTTRPHAPH